MPIIVYCSDSDNASELRKQYLQAHFDYIESILDKVSVAGPLGPPQPSDEPRHSGSLFIYQTDNLTEAQQLFFNDPYYQQGVYSQHEFKHFVPAAGDWIGGKIW